MINQKEVIEMDDETYEEEPDNAMSEDEDDGYDDKD